MADIDWQLEDLTAEYHHNAQQLDNAADELRSAQQQFQRKLEEKAAIVSQLHREADLGETAPKSIIVSWRNGVVAANRRSNKHSAKLRPSEKKTIANFASVAMS